MVELDGLRESTSSERNMAQATLDFIRQQCATGLRRLGRYGDRITVRMNASVGALLPVDWSVFRRDLGEREGIDSGWTAVTPTRHT